MILISYIVKGNHFSVAGRHCHVDISPNGLLFHNNEIICMCKEYFYLIFKHFPGNKMNVNLFREYT